MADHTYRPMSRQEISRTVDELKKTGAFNTIGQLCRTMGISRDEFTQYMEKEAGIDPPHYLRIMLALLTLPGALSVARQLSEATIINPDPKE